jgi:hypothetical protein
LIDVDGGNSATYGFSFSSGSESSVLKGLMITHFTSVQVDLGQAGSAGHPVRLLGNYIGTDGTNALGGYWGVYINAGNYSQVGGPNASDRNVISGNNGDNILIYQDGDHNIIQGNYIGLDASGNAAISGNSYGIELATVGTKGANYNQIIGNVISGNTSDGIYIHSQYDTNNLIQSNYIGTDARGTSAIANITGIGIDGGDSNQIGGSSTGLGNLISGNTSTGIDVEGSATNTKIFGNYIGTNASGTGAIPNSGAGIYLTVPADIGDGTTPGGNLISSNAWGIYANGASSTTIIGNNIGVSSIGGSLPNSASGIAIQNSTASAWIAQNYIANHTNYSVQIDSTSSAFGSNNCFVNNTDGLFSGNSGVTDDFTNNWWGSATGPHGAGSGSGDPVSLHVNYSPFLTSPAAACEAKVSLNSSSLDFRNQQVGTTSAARSVTLTNTGMAALSFTSITLPAHFSLDASTTCKVGTSVAASGTCKLALKFSPMTTGSAGGNVVITSDASNSPANLAVSGTGTTATASLNPTSVNFGFQQIITTSAIHPVTLTNTGLAPLSFSSIAPPAHFSLDASTTCKVGTPLAAGGTCKLALKYSPTALGSASGNVVITSNASNSPTNLPVSGIGVSAQLLKDPSFEGASHSEPASWTLSGINTKTDFIDCTIHSSGSCSLKLVGNGTQKTVSQTVSITGNAGNKYAFDLSSEASGVSSSAVYMVQVLFYKGGSLIGSKTFNFSTATSGFQTLSGTYSAPSAFTKIMFKITFKAGAGTVWFDAAGLFHES